MGTWSGLQIEVFGNAATTVATVCFMRVNGANGNQVAAVYAGQDGIFGDTSHSDTLLAGDTVGYYITGTSPSGVAKANLVGICNDVASPYSKYDLFGSSMQATDMGVNGDPGIIGFGSPVLITGGNAGATSAAEAARGLLAPFAFTASGLRITIANWTSSSSAYTFAIHTQVNGVSGNQQVSTLKANLPAVLEDTSHVDSVASSTPFSAFTSGVPSAVMYFSNLAISIDDGSATNANVGYFIYERMSFVDALMVTAIHSAAPIIMFWTSQ
jgi:hypothetical protein